MRSIILLVAGLALFVTGCQKEASLAPPQAVTLNEEAVGHYCQMNVLNHEGPKAQIHLAGKPHPIWFTQVRDAIAFTRLPEETDEVTAIYVNDMGKAQTWQNPGDNNWIDARNAFYVLESSKKGGMGAPEAIPFADQDAAMAFAKLNGGKVASYGDISDDYILAPVDVEAVVPKMDHEKQEITPKQELSQ